MRTLAIALLLAACPAPAPEEAPTVPLAEAEPLDVVAASFPAGWLAERIGGDKARVVVVLPAGEDAPHWQAPAEVVATAQGADLVVANGAGFEAWMKGATLPVDKVVHSADGLGLIAVEGGTHSHGGAGEHSHAGTDPHTWSDPATYALQAAAVHRAMVRAAPAHAETYDAGLRDLNTDLGALDAAMAAALAPAAELSLAANHPAWEYLERAYGLSILAFDLDPEHAPTEAQVAEVVAWAGATERRVMFWEAAPTEEVQAALPEGIEHFVVDPLEQPGAAGRYDYLAQAQGNVVLFLELFTEAPEADAGE